MTRIVPLVAALSLLATPAAAAVRQAPAPTPTPAMVPPAGSVVLVVMQSTGTILLPVGQAVIPPLAGCQS